MIVNLIYYQKNGLLTSAQHVGHGIIKISDTCCCIGHENNGVGLFNRDHNLLPDLSFKNIFAVRYKPPCINHIKCFTIPVSNAILPVPRYTTYVMNDRSSLLHHSVKESTLSHIRPSLNCYCKSHITLI